MGDSFGLNNKNNKNEKEKEKEVFGDNRKYSCSVKAQVGDTPLVPLKAQVGGHTSIRLYSETLVCKPLVFRELEFYKQLPSEILDFVPYFGGILSTHSRSSSKGKKTRRRTTSSDRSSSLHDDVREGEEQNSDEVQGESIARPLKTSGPIRKRQESSPEEYMLLENLTAGYKKPCVLDLKMGTRMYTDHASEAKRETQRRKAHESTSGRLGVRFCGSQRYSASTNSFQKLDKYIGRKVDVDGFRDLLRSFFTTGGYLRRNVIVTVQAQVRQLRRRLEKLDQFRFYSSSLLIVYDGLRPRINSFDSDGDESSLDGDQFFSSGSQKAPKARIKMIDFANVTFPGFLNDTKVHDGPDSGCILGLNNLSDILDGLVTYDDNVEGD